LDPNVNNNESEQDIIFIRRVADRIHRSGLITPAVFFLELTKPLSLIGSHVMIFFGPIINAFINTEGYYKAAELFEEPANVELLIREIEKLEDDLTHVEG
jgi:hypothetical protein